MNTRTKQGIASQVMIHEESGVKLGNITYNLAGMDRCEAEANAVSAPKMEGPQVRGLADDRPAASPQRGSSRRNCVREGMHRGV